MIQNEIQERMYHEIRSTVQDRKHPTWEDIQNMKLVRNSIKETMRLYLPIGALPRILSEDTVLNGYQVPAGVRKLFVQKTATAASPNLAFVGLSYEANYKFVHSPRLKLTYYKA